MTIQPTYASDQLTWTNVAIAILKGAANNKTLHLGHWTLHLVKHFPAPELVDEVRRSNPKLQLTVQAGSCESEHVTVGMIVV